MLDVVVPWWVAATLATWALAATALLVGLAVRRRRRGAASGPPATAAQALSHEIRTPLALVQGAAALLAEETPGPLTPAQRTFVDTVVRNADVVADMAEGFLLELRAERGELRLDAEAVDVRELVRESVRELRRLRHPDLVLDDRGAPLVVHADRRLVRQVLWNLVDNAVRHAGAGATVTVRVRGGDEGATLTVSDDGAGMTPEQRGTLFGERPAATSDDPGAGLGMGIAHRIVEAHGGRIVVDTLARRGTSLVVVLPWAPPDRASA